MTTVSKEPEELWQTLAAVFVLTHEDCSAHSTQYGAIDRLSAAGGDQNQIGLTCRTSSR